jgi:hypothetical protein
MKPQLTSHSLAPRRPASTDDPVLRGRWPFGMHGVRTSVGSMSCGIPSPRQLEWRWPKLLLVGIVYPEFPGWLGANFRSARTTRMTTDTGAGSIMSEQSSLNGPVDGQDDCHTVLRKGIQSLWRKRREVDPSARCQRHKILSVDLVAARVGAADPRTLSRDPRISIPTHWN